MNIKTINVIEVVNSSIKQVISFKDDESGRKEAQDLFRQIAEEMGCDKDEVDDYMAEGIFQLDGDPYYELYLVTSS